MSTEQYYLLRTNCRYYHKYRKSRGNYQILIFWKPKERSTVGLLTKPQYGDAADNCWYLRKLNKNLLFSNCYSRVNIIYLWWDLICWSYFYKTTWCSAQNYESRNLILTFKRIIITYPFSNLIASDNICLRPVERLSVGNCFFRF